MKTCFFVAFTFLMGIHSAWSQISPPGLDGTKAATWAAVGINQTINKKWNVVGYVGEARQSDPDNLSLLKKQAILVLNQETYWTIDSNWQLAFCTSFRLQSLYQHAYSPQEDIATLRDEIRYYTRLFYKHQVGKAALSYSFRPEYRSFYNSIQKPEHKFATELRFRLKVQLNAPIGQSKNNSYIIANEWLTATDHRAVEDGNDWSPYHFTENRLTTYIRHKFDNSPMLLDIGLMHQVFVKEGKLNYIPYLSLDLLFTNPFAKKK